jgi:hypothetical protein
VRPQTTFDPSVKTGVADFLRIHLLSSRILSIGIAKCSTTSSLLGLSSTVDKSPINPTTGVTAIPRKNSKRPCSYYKMEEYLLQEQLLASYIEAHPKLQPYLAEVQVLPQFLED